MTILNDFPVYGICSDEEKVKPISFCIRGEEAYCSLIIERSPESALKTREKVNAVIQPTERVKIEKLFNRQQVEDFRRAFDWDAKHESVGFSGVLFNDGKGRPVISRFNFTGWREAVQDCF